MPIPQLSRGMARIQEAAWSEFPGRYFHRLLAYALRLEKARAEETHTFSQIASHPAAPAERLLLLEEAPRQLTPEERRWLHEK